MSLIRCSNCSRLPMLGRPTCSASANDGLPANIASSSGNLPTATECDLPDHMRWSAIGDDAVRNIRKYQGAGADDGAFAQPDPILDDRADANPGLPANFHTASEANAR